MSRFKRWIEYGMNIWADLRDKKNMVWMNEQIKEMNRIWDEYMSRFKRWLEYGMNETIFNKKKSIKLPLT